MALAFRRCRPLLGTFVEVGAPNGFEAAVDRAFDAVAEVQAAMSFHDEGSDLARLRRARVGEWIAMTDMTCEVLRAAIELHSASGGLFDPTVGAALVRDGLLPEPAGWSDARATGGMGDLELGERSARVRRPLLLDLGGIAKGFAVDRAIEALDAAGVPAAVVNAGGDLRVLGEEPRRVVARDADGAVVAELMLADGALATSSFSDRGPTPHRAPDGTALSPGLVAVVAAPTCQVADAMTKIALLDEGLAVEMLDARGGAVVHVASSRPRWFGVAA